MSDSYKYKKYKTKYLELKNNCDKSYNYYFMHSTSNFENLIDILKDGIIYPGKYLRCEQRQMCGDQPSEFVFANIYFEDLKNISHMWDFSLLLHPKIMYENGMIFNKGWTGPPEGYVDIKITDSPNQINHKFYLMREFLKNPKEIPKIVQEAPGMTHHEILFDHPINLDNGTLLGMVCNYCDNDKLETIKKIVKDKSYKNIRIMTRNVPFPKLEEMIDDN